MNVKWSSRGKLKTDLILAMWENFPYLTEMENSQHNGIINLNALELFKSRASIEGLPGSRVCWNDVKWHQEYYKVYVI